MIGVVGPPGAGRQAATGSAQLMCGPGNTELMLMARPWMSCRSVLVLIGSAVGWLTVISGGHAQDRAVVEGPRLINPNAPPEPQPVPVPQREPADRPRLPAADPAPKPEFQLPVPPAPAPEIERRMKPNPVPAIPLIERRLPSSRVSAPPLPDRRLSTPDRFEAPSRSETLRLPPPPEYGLIPDRIRPGYRQTGVPPAAGLTFGATEAFRVAGPSPIHTRSYSEISRLTEKLATSVRDVHVYLDARGRVQPYLRQINGTRETLEGMKSLEKKGYPVNAIQQRYADYLTGWQLLEDSLGELIHFDPTLRQLVGVVNHYDTHLRQSLGYE